MTKTAPKKSVARRDRGPEVTRGRLIAAATAAALLLGGSGSALGVFAVTSAQATDRVAAAEAWATDRVDALAAGSAFLTTMFTVDDGSLQRWDSAVLGATTDSMHDQLTRWRAVLEKLVAAHLEMSSTVKEIGVVTQDGDAVTLLAVIESTGRTDPAADPGTSSSAALIDLRRLDGRWRVSGYGPAAGLPPAAPAAPAAAPESPAPVPPEAAETPR
ncbi:hypothetical protein ABZ319_36160 [Nocardia sp. NPDC005978]|uniref:hypothetical protein n=1 Tax=Nocardia sp. NPDC005978 TaxID=3156725 RepID=UPI0033AE2F4C